jgi:hypothetical protein
VPPKRHFTFNALQGVISQKTKLFIITAVRTSNLLLLWWYNRQEVREKISWEHKGGVTNAVKFPLNYQRFLSYVSPR